jgi:hypothetical protein
MKVKIKLTVGQFAALIAFVKDATYEGLDELQVLNIRLFLPFGLKKLIDCKPSEYATSFNKTKSFSIELNQYTAIMALLTRERNNVDPYTLAIFITLQNQNKNLLNLTA